MLMTCQILGNRQAQTSPFLTTSRSVSLKAMRPLPVCLSAEKLKPHCLLSTPSVPHRPEMHFSSRGMLAPEHSRSRLGIAPAKQHACDSAASLQFQTVVPLVVLLTYMQFG